MNFASDNTAPVAPEILEAVVRANEGFAPGYGADPWTGAVERRFWEIFERDVAVFLVPTGTAANALALAHVAPPWGVVLCHAESHIATDECGAPEFFGAGLKLAGLPGDGAKIAPETLKAALAGYGGHNPHQMVPAALSFGLSGFPYWHAEVAGYVDGDLNQDQARELWLRWLQLASWTSMLRDHLGDHPSAPVDAWLDEGTLSAFTQVVLVHASLVPYLYSLAAEASRSGLPLVRYMPLEVPDDPRACQQEQSYFLGPTLLVAPVMEPGATTRTVYLPAGKWVDYWRGTVYTGGQEVTVAAPLEQAGPPVFARAGALIPLAADYDSLVPATDASVGTWSGDLLIRIMPGAPAGAADAAFTLYDGTSLRWTGTALEVAANPTPRRIEVRTPDGRAFSQYVGGAAAVIG